LHLLLLLLLLEKVVVMSWAGLCGWAVNCQPLTSWMAVQYLSSLQ
jgi:hypothetical protein